MRVHSDERRIAYCDVFAGVGGDVNVFYLKPDQPSGWHRHRYQEDQFFVAQGTVVFGRWADGETPEYSALGPGDMLTIHPNIWHGYYAPTGATLVMYLSHKYEHGWDEERKSFDEVHWDTTPVPVRWFCGPLVDDEWNKGQDPPDETTV